MHRRKDSIEEGRDDRVSYVHAELKRKDTEKTEEYQQMVVKRKSKLSMLLNPDDEGEEVAFFMKILPADIKPSVITRIVFV